MIKKAMVIVSVVLGMSSPLWAHCEIPCGIYNDSMRVVLLKEHITTVEKSMSKIVELSGAKERDENQLSRWVSNKEVHASEIQEIVTQYFMTQRIKPETEQYEKKVTLLHKILISAMKAKQTTDQKHIETLRSLVAEFDKLYFHKK